jgi:hypothetical protein
VRAPARPPLTLKSINRGSGMRLVQEGAEIWEGYILLGEVSGEWLAQVVREKFDALESLQGLSRALQSPTTIRYVKHPPAALPARVVPHEIQEQRRSRRRGKRS